LKRSMMGAIAVENCFSPVLIENGRVEPTTLRPIIVNDASLTIVKNTSSRRVFELLVSTSFDDEEILRKAKTFYPYDV